MPTLSSLSPKQLILLATLFNLVTVYCVKASPSFRRPLPAAIALITICVTQWLLSCATDRGMDLGSSVTMLVVCVMIGAAVMGRWFFGEAVSAQRILGLGIAVAGVAISSFSRT